ncbi:MAG: aminoacyl-tRNA hydrolase [Halobacteriovoraceae bacterium]|nr:aminoacyl-tRNA hydrolase [Halobacteriovoraceae bacterium]
MDYLIVGLGNPGSEYEGTRHNIAWDCIENSSFSNKLIWKNKFKGEFSTFDIQGNKVVFLKPMTYMNLSGESVIACSKFFKVLPSNILVVHDEIDLDFGTLVFKDGGGLAGHNGLKSVNQHLSTPKFKRLRVGVGKPKYGDVASWVLSRFSTDESLKIDHLYKLVSDALEDFMKNGFDSASRKFSRKKI